MLKISVKCKSCGKFKTIKVQKAEYHRWRYGAKIQDCMPYLSASERELMISGLCGECFDSLTEEVA